MGSDCNGVVHHLNPISISDVFAVEAPVELPGTVRVASNNPFSVRRLTVVVPCFNEEPALEPLIERLHDLKSDLSELEELRVILVDDGSRDQTWAIMQRMTATLDWITCLRHDENAGISAAIMTGMRAAATEWVATLDSDCTYDPLQLRRLLVELDSDVSMVTASPYHPQGEVVGVPGWRLLLSKAASTAYSAVIRVDLHTYTSCFRIYKRSVFVDVSIRNPGFVGMAELLWVAVRAGGTVRETPAVLTSRRVGYSKLRTLPVVAGHLRLLSQIIYQRFLSNFRSEPR